MGKSRQSPVLDPELQPGFGVMSPEAYEAEYGNAAACEGQAGGPDACDAGPGTPTLDLAAAGQTCTTADAQREWWRQDQERRGIVEGTMPYDGPSLRPTERPALAPVAAPEPAPAPRERPTLLGEGGASGLLEPGLVSGQEGAGTTMEETLDEYAHGPTDFLMLGVPAVMAAPFVSLPAGAAVGVGAGLAALSSTPEGSTMAMADGLSMGLGGGSRAVAAERAAVREAAGAERVAVHVDLPPMTEAELLDQELDAAFRIGDDGFTRARSGTGFRFDDSLGPLEGTGPRLPGRDTEAWRFGADPAGGVLRGPTRQKTTAAGAPLEMIWGKSPEDHIWYHNNVKIPGIGPNGKPAELRNHATDPRYPHQGDVSVVSTKKDDYLLPKLETDDPVPSPPPPLEWKPIGQMDDAERARAHVDGGKVAPTE